MEHEPYYFEWVDACGDSGWFATEDLSPPVVVKSLGYVVEETPNYVTISCSVCEGLGKFLGYTTIPQPWIRKRKKIRVP